MKRPRKPIRLVGLDLDGTTLNTDHRLSRTTIDTICAVTARGVKVVLASGRLPHSILPFARELGLDGVHLALNGGVAFDLEGRILHRHVMDLGQLAFAHEILAEADLEPMVFCPAGIWVPRMTANVELVLSYGEPAPRTYHLHNLGEITDPVKVLTVLDAGPCDQWLAHRAEPRLHAIRTGPLFFEFMAPGVGKGPSLAEVAADLGIDRDEVMAIGDSENDASLLQAAGFAVAMGNAAPAVKALADAVTGTNGEDGVAQALRHYILEYDGL